MDGVGVAGVASALLKRRVEFVQGQGPFIRSACGHLASLLEPGQRLDGNLPVARAGESVRVEHAGGDQTHDVGGGENLRRLTTCRAK